VKGIEIGE